MEKIVKNLERDQKIISKIYQTSIKQKIMPEISNASGDDGLDVSPGPGVA
jgi:hypothetical protein